MDVVAGLYMYDVVVKKFTFAISSPDEFLVNISAHAIELQYRTEESQHLSSVSTYKAKALTAKAQTNARTNSPGSLQALKLHLHPVGVWPFRIFMQCG